MCWNVFIQGCHLEEEIDLFTASKDQKLAICRAKDGPTFSAINQLEYKYFRPCGLQQPLNFTIVTWKYSQMIHKLRLLFSRSVTRALCNPRDCCTPGFPILYHLPEPAQTHVRWVSDAIQTILSSVIPFSSCLPPFLASGSFPMSWLFASGGQSIGASASVSSSVLPMNVEGWSP